MTPVSSDLRCAIWDLGCLILSYVTGAVWYKHVMCDASGGEGLSISICMDKLLVKKTVISALLIE